VAEKLGKNKVNDNGTVSVPKPVLNDLDLEKGEDIIGFKKEDGEIKIVPIEAEWQ
jgi:bifunctional DNA-binding transcriptional regulator/antitoxin component of YhaV-PrlF toxin-antitoxin module